MNKSANISNIAVALSKAQAKMPVAVFDARNPFLKNKYATLGQVIETSKPIMAEHGLSISQFPTSQVVNGVYMVGVNTILMHESGEFLEETVLLIPEKQKGVNDGQTAGIVITYCRRYAWASVLGMYSDADTDGQSQDELESASADESVKKVMADTKTGEVQLTRVWSLDQMEVLVSKSDGTIQDYDVAKRILDFSALPESAPIATVESWFKHYLKSKADTEFGCAADANKAYIEAKKKTKK